MKPANNTNFELMVSKPRLNSYHSYFKTTNLDETIGLYIWNCDLSIALNALLSHLEIALRNNIHKSVSLFCSSNTSNSFKWYDTLYLYPKMSTSLQRKVDEVLKDRSGATIHPPPSADEVVSKLSFGFWPNLLKSLDKSYTNQIMPAIFPNHPMNANPVDWKTKNKFNVGVAPLWEIIEFRNRIAHHESIWKFSKVTNPLNPTITLIRASKNITESINRLSRILNIYDDILGWINQDMYTDLYNSSWRNRVNYLISNKGIDRYKLAKNHIASLPITSEYLHNNFSVVTSTNQPILITHNGEKGLFYPL